MVLLEKYQKPIGLLTDERHGSRILKNGQHVFTPSRKRKIGEKSVEKLWNEGLIVCFDTLKLREDPMKVSTTTVEFRKTAACPASATLLSHLCNNLPAEAATGVKEHLEECDFCGAELRLLVHHQPVRGANKTPEIPMDLRILAESILATKSTK